QRECLEGAGLDGTDRHPPPQVPATAVALRVVAVELGRAVAHEPLHASRPVGVVGYPVSRPADRADRRPSRVGPCVIGTAEPGDLIAARVRSCPIRPEMPPPTTRSTVIWTAVSTFVAGRRYVG